MFDRVASMWKQQIAADAAGQRRIDTHPLALYFGANEASSPIFFLITEVEPDFPRLADVVSVERGRRDDGRWTIVLTLQNRDLTDAFIGMCVELARRSAVASNEFTARAIFFETLQDWKALLAGTVPKRLSKDQLRGLLAELWFALEMLGAELPLGDALLAWHGPYGAPQDFQTADGSMYEVKSVHAGSRTVEISSADQLDPRTPGSLSLVLVSVEEVPAGTLGHYTLQSLVDEFSRRLSGDPRSLGEFEHRLAALSLDTSDPSFADLAYAIGSPRTYSVVEGFPRISRANVPLAVDKLTYRLRIAGFEEFEKKANHGA